MRLSLHLYNPFRCQFKSFLDCYQPIHKEAFHHLLQTDRSFGQLASPSLCCDGLLFFGQIQSCQNSMGSL